jgi:hypothetical protein
MPPRPKRPEGSYWLPVSTGGLVALIAASSWLLLLLRTDEDGFIQILDSFNLVVHEFGHPFFGVLGEEPMIWGGTLAQLLLPLSIAVVFWYQRSALSLAFAGVWFFENFLNVARYMADARAQELPLIGGGEHDWLNIFSRHGLLESDTAIASVVRTAGWIGMVSCMAFALTAWYLQRPGRLRHANA